MRIYSDGACLGNPGRGGYGVVLSSGAERQELSGGFRRTTNNRMELVAAIVGLEALETQSRVTLYSDSRYLVDGMRKGWARNWQARGWKRRKQARVENVDLWEHLLELAARYECEFVWVQGHAGNPENERAHQLSMQAAQRQGLDVDVAYERGRRFARIGGG